MIEAIFFKKGSEIVGFEVRNHGRDIVCSAVSILTLNTVNSLDAFTECVFSLEYDDLGGYLKCELEVNSIGEDAKILLLSLELGLRGIAQEYPKDISIKNREVK